MDIVLAWVKLKTRRLLCWPLGHAWCNLAYTHPKLQMCVYCIKLRRKPE